MCFVKSVGVGSGCESCICGECGVWGAKSSVCVVVL